MDSLPVAQFVYQPLNNAQLRSVIDEVSSRDVFIPGRFGEHKANLDVVRDKLRGRRYFADPVRFRIAAAT